jgi:predicted metallopeptidase
LVSNPYLAYDEPEHLRKRFGVEQAAYIPRPLVFYRRLPVRPELARGGIIIVPRASGHVHGGSERIGDLLAHEIAHAKLKHPGELEGRKERAREMLKMTARSLGVPQWRVEKKLRDIGLNPSPSHLSAKEHCKVQSMMRRLGIRRVAITVDPNSSRDIAVYLGSSTPHIVTGRKWLAAPYHERMKRVCHELLHIAGMRHDGKSRAMGYYSNPKRDTYSAAVYRELSGGSRG